MTASTLPQSFPPSAAAGTLFWTLVRTDFKSRYQGTWGGFVWALLKPMSLFIVLMSVFSFVFASRATYRLDLIVGLFLWDFFAEGTKTGLISLHAKGYLLTKARCPAWILVISSLANAALTLGVFSVVIVAFLGFSGHWPTPAGMGLFVLYCLALMAIVAGFSLGTSVLFLRYRDLNQVWDVATQAGFLVAPIIYPLEVLPERFHAWLYLWPPTPIIEFSRAVLVDGTVPTLKAHLLLAALTGSVLLAGTLVFRRLSPRAAEYL